MQKTLDLPDSVRSADPDTVRRYEWTLRHKLAMESIGLVRTLIRVQAPAFQRLLDAEQELRTAQAQNSGHAGILYDKSFALQVRMAKTALRVLAEFDALADEAIDLAAKEKPHGRTST